MSGLEIVLLIAGGIYITKKVQERKKQKQLTAVGSYPQSRPLGGRTTQRHGIPQLVQRGQSQQVPAEEELLPAYTPPTQSGGGRTQPDGDEKGGLPTYDETVGGAHGREGRGGVGVDPLLSTTARLTSNLRLEGPASADETKKGHQRRWKMWKKDEVQQI